MVERIEYTGWLVGWFVYWLLYWLVGFFSGARDGMSRGYSGADRSNHVVASLDLRVAWCE